MRLIRGLLFLCFSCIPGCGQMHQGYMKRGISQTMLCCGILAVAIFLEIGALAMLVAPLWLYSFFDSYNLRRQRLEGLIEEDAYLFGMSDLDARRMNELLSKRHSFIGWALVVMGIYVLYHTVAHRLLGWLWDLFPWLGWLYELLVWDMPRMLGTLLVIALGIWFIRGPRPKEYPEDTPVFTPSSEERPVYAPEFFEEAPHAPDISSGGSDPESTPQPAEQEAPHDVH